MSRHECLCMVCAVWSNQVSIDVVLHCWRKAGLSVSRPRVPADGLPDHSDLIVNNVKR